eukprot:TRINITY_DN3041_c0_g1_i1.p1 TRINITY_DN3041_c0_g1~~TRINITY_DN3041_c0_g1_i1.p1  ORF type:complete len:593 (+),score=162.94 TRINITY_DN3041_c0_g1_i1:64-1842(+)
MSIVSGPVATTPQLLSSEPPELVPMECAIASTPPRVLGTSWKIKASTPNPTRLVTEDIQFFGACTPPPGFGKQLDDSLLDKTLTPEHPGCDDLPEMHPLDQENEVPSQSTHPNVLGNYQSHGALKAQPLQQYTTQYQNANIITNDVQNQQQGPGTLCPVWDEGKLVGYMSVPTPQQQQQQQQTRVPDSAYFGQQQQNALRPTMPSMSVMGNQFMKETPATMTALQQQQADWEAGLIDINSIKGRVLEVARDHTGSRTLQRRLDLGCTDDEKKLLFAEIEPEVSDLMTHMFGNYVIQKMFEHGLPDQVHILSEKLRGNVLNLTLSPYGCRVIQKALEVIEPVYKDIIIAELTGHVPRCVQDQNGNHVIQKCIEAMPNRVEFIVSAFNNNVHVLAVHAYGCRVIQRLLEYCRGSNEVEPINQEVLESVDQLVGDRYGNYVVQHVIINGGDHHRQYLYMKLRTNVLALAKGKFSSNVVEKMFEYGCTSVRDDLLAELLQYSVIDGMTGLLAMVQDPYANYVVQKMLDCSGDRHQQQISDHIKPHLATLRRYNYGKHIITRLEKAGLGGYPKQQLQPQPLQQQQQQFAQQPAAYFE